LSAEYSVKHLEMKLSDKTEAIEVVLRRGVFSRFAQQQKRSKMKMAFK
jgi:hypothetical protein